MKRLIAIILAVVMLCNFIAPAYAYGGGCGRGYGYGWGWGLGGFVIGTIITAVTLGACTPRYQTVYVAGAPYYVCNGMYYQRDYCGNYYAVPAPIVVQPAVYQQPVVVAQPAPVIAQQPAPVTAAPITQAQPQIQDTATINIPNSGGGYTAVALKRSGNGYVGPQGEYYPGNPTVEQLKVLYGK